MPEMTPSQAREWFEKIDKAFPNTYYRHEDGAYTPLSAETIYQAIKTRLIEETTCCELPKDKK